MKLLYAAMDPVPWPKGASVRIQATIRTLLSLGARITLVTLRGGERLEWEGLQHHTLELPQENFLDRALAFRAEVAGLARGDFQLAIVRSIWEGCAIPESLPLIYEAHGFPSLELPYHFPKLRRETRLLAKMIEEENGLLRRARLLLTPSATGARFLHTRGVPPQRIRILPNSLAEDDFLQTAAPVWEPPYRLLYVGTLAPWQGVELLLESLALLKNRIPVKLQLAGTRKGVWLRRLRRLSQQLRVRSQLELLGPLDHATLRHHLADAHICVAPLPDDPRNSVQGCCPIKLLEYMAAARPILSTRISPVEELLEHSHNAWLVPPNSGRALSDGIRHLISHPELALQLGERARATARQRFLRLRFERRWEEVAREITEWG